MAFLDSLRCEKVRQAFTSGDAAFVVSTDCQTILWANGAGALYFDFDKIMEAIGSPSFFDAKTRRDICHFAGKGESFKISALNNETLFDAYVIDLDDQNCAILLQAVAQNLQNGPVSLIRGLADTHLSAAIVDGAGQVLEASENFNGVSLATNTLLKSIDDDAPLKTRFIEDGWQKEVGVIRLSEQPDSFLLLAAEMQEANLLEKEPVSINESRHLNPSFSLPQRFTWRMDKDGRFIEISQNFIETLGAQAGMIVGNSFSDISEIMQNDSFQKLDEAVKTHKPWADITVVWFLGHDNGKYSITFSGLPMLDRHGELTGFRGFGTITDFQPANGMPALEELKDNTKAVGLTDTERSAFREIAERLRLDMALTELPAKSHKLEPDEHVLNILEKEPDTTLNDAPKAATLLSLLDTATDGVIWLDRFGNIEQMSSAACALTGYDPLDLKQKKLSDIFSDNTCGFVQKYFDSLQNHGKGQIFNTGETANIVTKNGGESTVFITLVPLMDRNGYAALLRDTAAQHLDAPVVEIQQSAAIAHEIRTPLNAMIGFAEIMQEERFGKIGNNRYRGYVRDIAACGKHILSLVNQLLEKGKNYQSGHNRFETVKAEIQPFDLHAAIRNSVSMLENQANNAGVIIRVVLPNTLPSIAISEQTFRQILWNLLSNSIRFTHSGGQVVVNAGQNGKSAVKITISDNGVGMSTEEMLRAMEPYGQIERIDGRKGDEVFTGTGLGLPMTKAMVEECEGSFLLLSKPNRGTTVEMTFPLLRG